MSRYITHSSEETQLLGKKFGLQLSPNAVVCFFGALGTGKTTFIKGIASSVIPEFESEINSPTFTYLNIYTGVVPLYHFDLYRLRDADEFLSMGFDEVLYSGGICCIEWSEKIANLLISDIISIEMAYLNQTDRQIDISPSVSSGFRN